MKSIKQWTRALAAAALLSITVSTPALAQNALFHSGQASVNSVRAVGHGLAAVGKTAVTIVAIPFKAVGAIGGLSDKTGDALLEAGNAPLEIGEQHATVGAAPNVVLNQEGEE